MTDTDKQIITIQGRAIVKYIFDKVADMNDKNITPKDLVKIQKMFNIINDNKLNYGIEKNNTNQ
jgi:hypothetical protein